MDDHTIERVELSAEVIVQEDFSWVSLGLCSHVGGEPGCVTLTGRLIRRLRVHQIERRLRSQP